MKKYSKQEIIDEYNNLCSIANKRLTRTEYRNYNTVCSSTTIEGILSFFATATLPSTK